MAELRRVEREHLDEEQALQHAAQARADGEAAGGSAAFLELFEQARGLFGPSWPIAMPGAIGPAAAPSTAQGSAA